MDLLHVLLIVIVLLVISYLLFFPSPIPDIPGLSFHDYLPGGLGYRLNINSHLLNSITPEIAKRYGEIFQVRIGIIPTILLSNPQDIAHVATGSKDFVRTHNVITLFESVFPRSFFTMHTDEHRVARRQLRERFNHSVLQHFHQPMLQAIDEVLDNLCSTLTDAAKSTESNIVDIAQHLPTVTMRVILNVAFGAHVNHSERDQLGDSLNDLNDEMLDELIQYPFRGAFEFMGTRKRLKRIVNRFNKHLRPVLNKRLAETPKEKAQRTPDLLDAIVALDDHDVERWISEMFFFSFAGTHTQANSVAFAFYHICKDPRIREKLEEEIQLFSNSDGSTGHFSFEDISKLTYVNNIWKETLRFRHPVANLPRRATRDVILKGTGYKVPKGTDVWCSMHLVHKNAKLWDEPHKFIPERWGSADSAGEVENLPPGSFMPYGLGQRNCAGQFLADFQGPLLIAELFRRYRFELACPPEEVKAHTGLLEIPRWSSKKNGVYDMGVPLVVRER